MRVGATATLCIGNPESMHQVYCQVGCRVPGSPSCRLGPSAIGSPTRITKCDRRRRNRFHKVNYRTRRSCANAIAPFQQTDCCLGIAVVERLTAPGDRRGDGVLVVMKGRSRT